MIDTERAIERERALLNRMNDSDLGRQLAHQAKQLRGRESDPELSVDQQDELLATLLKAGATQAIGDLEQALSDAEGRAAFQAKQYGDESQGLRLLRDVLPGVQEQARLARLYRSRLAALRAKQSGQEIAGPVQPAPTEVAEVHAIFLEAAGDRYVAELSRILEAMTEELPVRLHQVVADIAACSTVHANGPRNTGLTDPHDAQWDRLSWLIWRKTDLQNKIARVSMDSAKAVQVQGDAVKAAVAQAGGADVVARAVADSRKIVGTYWRSHPDYVAVDASKTTIASIDAQLAKLGGDAATGPVADQLRADRKTAEQSGVSNTSTVDADLRAAIVAQISAAMDGDETARVAILGDALAEPRAFPAGFADALDAAAFPKSADGSRLLSLVLSTGLPLSG